MDAMEKPSEVFANSPSASLHILIGNFPPKIALIPV
jgi:hypothetical protein